MTDRPIRSATAIPALVTCDHLSAMIDAVPALVAFFDTDHVCRFANVHLGEWHGRAPVDLIGLHLTRFIGDEEYQRRSSLLQQLTLGQRISFTADVPHRSGISRAVTVRYIPRVGIEGFEGFYAVAHDMHFYEQRFNSVFDGTPIGLLIVDLAELKELFASASPDVMLARLDDPAFVRSVHDNIRVIDANAKACELLGAGRGDILAHSLGHWYPDEEMDVVAQAMRDMLAGRTSFQNRLRLRRADGLPIEVLLSTNFSHATPGETKIAVAITDLTEQVRHEEKLADAQTVLTHAARVATLGELTASIAHDVNQPLSAVIANAMAAIRWMDRPQPDLGEARDALHRIGSEATRAAEVIGRIRALAKRRDRRRDPVAVSQVLATAVEIVRRQIAELGARIQLYDRSPNVVILADQVQLQQVIINLMLNAGQAMAGAGSAVRLLTISSQIDRGLLVIKVADTGPGIDPRHRDRIFDAFYTTRPEGMGLGLSIICSIVKDHDGTVEVGHSSSDGTEFVVSLPLPSPNNQIEPQTRDCP